MKNFKTGFDSAQGSEKRGNEDKLTFTLSEGATHVDLLPTKAKGFTLAEVLITLGIIGVVAAMTIPTLVANTRSQQYRSQFKKTLSTLNQAARMAQAQYDFDFGTMTATSNVSYSTASCKTETPQTDKTMCALLNGTLNSFSINYASNYHNLNISNTVIYSSGYLVYQLADGTNFIFQNNRQLRCSIPIGESVIEIREGSHAVHEITMLECVGYIDVNGNSKPNKEVKCANEETKLDPTTTCKVDNASMGDIFPVIFHDGTVEPATNAAAYVLNTAK